MLVCFIVLNTVIALEAVVYSVLATALHDIELSLLIHFKTHLVSLKNKPHFQPAAQINLELALATSSEII